MRLDLVAQYFLVLFAQVVVNTLFVEVVHRVFDFRKAEEMAILCDLLQ
jgi:hypothetical protein